MQTKEFVLFEESLQRFAADDYDWEFVQANKRSNRNLVGTDKQSGRHCFTWQPHGSQFTIRRDVPGSARKFTINRNVPLVDPAAILAHVQYRDSWIGLAS